MFESIAAVRRILLVAMAGIVMALLCSCDRMQSQRATPKPVAKKPVPPPLEPRFKAACAKTATGKYDEAAQAFAQINEENDPSQPLYNWIMVQQALALMLAGKDAEARALFGKLEDAGPFSSEPDEKKLAKFFVSLAHAQRSEEPIPPTAAQEYDKWTYEAFGLLFAALKNWNLEKFDDALPLLRQFFSSSPKGPPLWIGEEEYVARLREMAGGFADDFAQYRQITEGLAKARTPEQQKEAIEAAKVVRAEMKYPSKLTRTIDDMIGGLQPKVMAAVHENERLSAEAEAEDSKAFASAREKGEALLKEFRFEEARTTFLEPTLKQEKRIEEQKFLAKKAQWLISFKSNLMKDLTVPGFPGPVIAKNGNVVAGAVIKADDQGIQIRTAKGVFPAKWTELAPESIFTMAKSFITDETPVEIAGFKKWHLGTFASVIGKKEEAVALFKEAAQLRPVFERELPAALETVGK